jgi:hypothetical protein
MLFLAGLRKRKFNFRWQGNVLYNVLYKEGTVDFYNSELGSIIDGNDGEFADRLANIEINKQDALGTTILMYAAAQNQVEMVKLLLAKGANPLLQDNYGRTVFDIVKIILKNKDDLKLTSEEQAKYKLILQLCYKRILKHLMLLQKRKTAFWGVMPMDLINVIMVFLSGFSYNDMCKKS